MKKMLLFIVILVVFLFMSCKTVVTEATDTVISEAVSREKMEQLLNTNEEMRKTLEDVKLDTTDIRVLTARIRDFIMRQDILIKEQEKLIGEMIENEKKNNINAVGDNVSGITNTDNGSSARTGDTIVPNGQ